MTVTEKPPERREVPAPEPVIERPREEEKPVKLSLTTKLRSVFVSTVSLNDREIEDFLEGINLSMLESDVSYEATEAFISDLREKLRNNKINAKDIQHALVEQVRAALFDILAKSGQGVDIYRFINERTAAKTLPIKILFLGPNVTGKTTTMAKIAHHLKKNGISSVLSASDTFRAAAIEQTEHHANKVGVPVIKSRYGADPASIAFDAIAYAKAHQIAAVLIDTAGRQETNNNLIDHNEIYDTYEVGIGVGASYTFNYNTVPDLAYDNIVEFNDVHNIGQGVLSDMGGIYMAVYNATGNKIINNVVHDVNAYQGNSLVPEAALGYGGWGLYFDAGSRNVYASNNLVYRTTYPSVHNNYGQNNTVVNNIFAFGAKGLVDDSENDGSSYGLLFSHNIFYWDKNSEQGSLLRGSWACENLTNGTLLPCTKVFLFSDNLYQYTNGTPTFLTTHPTKLYNLQQWKDIGEDADSEVANPMFANPYYPFDNFTLQESSPAFNIGFMPFNYTEVGLLSGVRASVPYIPEAFPTQIVSYNGF